MAAINGGERAGGRRRYGSQTPFNQIGGLGADGCRDAAKQHNKKNERASFLAAELVRAWAERAAAASNAIIRALPPIWRGDVNIGTAYLINNNTLHFSADEQNSNKRAMVSGRRQENNQAWNWRQAGEDNYLRSSASRAHDITSGAAWGQTEQTTKERGRDIA